MNNTTQSQARPEPDARLKVAIRTAFAAPSLANIEAVADAARREVMDAIAPPPLPRVIIGEALGGQVGMPISAPVARDTKSQYSLGEVRWRKRTDTFVLERFTTVGWVEVPCLEA